jgi:serine/threonine-protein kinase
MMESNGTPAADEVGAALARITASAVFSKAGRTVSLLRYLVNQELAGRGAGLKESVIALDVYQRSNYNPKTESLVRVEVGRLRRLLEQYYSLPGSEDRVRIEIPKGSYVPLYRVHDVGWPDHTPNEGRTGRNPPGKALIAAGILILLAGALVTWRLSRRVAAAHASHPSQILSLAVLPLEDMSPDKDQEALCSGLTEELTAALSRENLRVAARTSVAGYRRKERDARAIGRELDVRALIEGSVRREGERVRITLQLINTTDGFDVWSRTYDRGVHGSLAVEKDVAQDVVSVFHSELANVLPALARQQSSNREAWFRYLQAAEYSSRSEAVKAAEAFEAATAIDPGYAAAWAALANHLAIAVDWREQRAADVRRRATLAAQRAITLDPTLPEAHYVLGLTRILLDRDWAGADAAMRRALELDPVHIGAHVDLARLVLGPQRRFAEAVKLLERAIVLNPKDHIIRLELASIYTKMALYDEAQEELDQAHSLVSDSAALAVQRGQVALGRGHLVEAVGHFETGVKRRRSSWTLGQLGLAYARLGRFAEVDKVKAELKALSTQTTPDYEIAAMDALLESKDAAFAGLDRAVTEFAPAVLFVNVDPTLAGLRSDPRFAALLQRVSLTSP